MAKDPEFRDKYWPVLMAVFLAAIVLGYWRDNMLGVAGGAMGIVWLLAALFRRAK